MASISSSIASICWANGRQRLAHEVGNHDLAVAVMAGRQQAFEPVGVLGALRRHDADLRQMASQHIQHPRAIASQQLARAMARTATKRMFGRRAQWCAEPHASIPTRHGGNEAKKASGCARRIDLATTTAPAASMP
jgi:hypothetical protein